MSVKVYWKPEEDTTLAKTVKAQSGTLNWPTIAAALRKAGFNKTKIQCAARLVNKLEEPFKFRYLKREVVHGRLSKSF